MNEDEWFSEIDFTRQIGFVDGRLSKRKSRLLAAALCRVVLPLFDENTHRDAVEAAEEFADGSRTLGELEEYRWRFREEAVRAHEKWQTSTELQSSESLKWLLRSYLAWAISYTTTVATPLALHSVGQSVSDIATRARTGESGVIRAQGPSTVMMMAQQNLALRELVHDVAGNPFRPPEFVSAWRSGTAVAVARAMYQARDFSAMPILADALQDAGCNDPAVLDHCRGPGKHVRGCWVVDRLLEFA